MTEKNVLLGFILATTVLFMNSDFLFIGLVTDLLVLSAYLLSKYLYLHYKTDGRYLEKMYMVPLYIVLIMAALTAGIFSILGRYALLFANFSSFWMFSVAIKTYIVVEVLMLFLFTYLLFKTILVDVLELNLVVESGKGGMKGKSRKTNANDEPIEKVAVFGPVEEAVPRDELYPYQVKKLPVILVVERDK